MIHTSPSFGACSNLGILICVQLWCNPLSLSLRALTHGTFAYSPQTRQLSWAALDRAGGSLACINGKLEALLASVQLMALPEDQQLDTLLGYMLAQASEASGIDDLDPDQPLLELGLDSLRAAEFAVQVRQPSPHTLR